MRLRLTLLLLATLFLSSCNFDKYVLMSKKDWDEEKAKIEKLYGDRAQQAIADIEKKREEHDAAVLANEQKTAALGYQINQISEMKPETQRTRPEILVNKKSREIVARMPGMTSEQLLAANDELRNELNETLTTLADLQKKYDAQLAQAKQDKKTIDDINIQIENKKKELESIQHARDAAMLKLQSEQIKAQEKEKERLAEKADDKESRERLIKYMITIFISLGVASAVAAYATRSIVLAVASLGFIGLSIFIGFLEPWMVITAGCIVLAAGIAGLLLEWQRTHKNGQTEKDLADRLVGSIQEFKDRVGTEKFKSELAPHIEEWVKDMPQLKDKIESKLKELNLK